MPRYANGQSLPCARKGGVGGLQIVCQQRDPDPDVTLPLPRLAFFYKRGSVPYISLFLPRVDQIRVGRASSSSSLHMMFRHGEKRVVPA